MLRTSSTIEQSGTLDRSQEQSEASAAFSAVFSSFPLLFALLSTLSPPYTPGDPSAALVYIRDDVERASAAPLPLLRYVSPVFLFRRAKSLTFVSAALAVPIALSLPLPAARPSTLGDRISNAVDALTEHDTVFDKRDGGETTIFSAALWEVDQAARDVRAREEEMRRSMWVLEEELGTL